MTRPEADAWEQIRRPLWLVLAVGLVVRVVVDVVAGGNGDITHEQQAAAIIASQPLHIYTLQHGPVWPYPPGWFGAIALEHWLSGTAGIRFAILARLPVIVADIATAWVVARWLADRGRPAKQCLLGAALLAWNPYCIVISSYHGQLDQIATLGAVLAVWQWSRLPECRRAWVAGVLLGVAAVIKPAPAIVALALLVLCRGIKEILLLLVPITVIVAGVLAPWVSVSWAATRFDLSYQGLPGAGGISVLIQHKLANVWLAGQHATLSSTMRNLEKHAMDFTLLAAALALIALALSRPRPEVGAVLALLPVYCLGLNISAHYLTWALPFVVVAAAPMVAGAFCGVLVVLATFVYTPVITSGGRSTGGVWSISVVQYVYVPLVIGLMVIGLLTFAIWTGRLTRERYNLRLAAAP